jgi:hypothetical protein
MIRYFSWVKFIISWYFQKMEQRVVFSVNSGGNPGDIASDSRTLYNLLSCCGRLGQVFQSNVRSMCQKPVDEDWIQIDFGQTV